MNKLILIPCGTSVKTIYGGVIGMITGVVIRFKDVQYEFSYFNLGKQECIWLRDGEFNIIDMPHKQIEIGFKPAK